MIRKLRHGGLLPFDLTAGGLAVWVVTGACAVLGFALSSRPLVLLAYGTAAAGLTSILLTPRARAVRGSRSGLPPRIKAGTAVTVEVEVTSSRSVSGIVLKDELPPLLGHSVLVPVRRVRRSDTFRYHIAPPLRGVYRVGPLYANWTDPFGLIQRRVVLQPETRLVVHPPEDRIPDRIISRRWEDPPLRPEVSIPVHSGFDFAGMREYRPGDDPRRIAWRASARLRAPPNADWHLLVREAEQGLTDQVVIVVDTDEGSYTARRPEPVFEAAVRSAAGLGGQHLREGFEVSLLTNAGPRAERLRGLRHRTLLLDELAAVQFEPFPLARALQSAARNPSRAHTVVITPALDGDSARTLAMLKARHASVMVVLLSGSAAEAHSIKTAVLLGLPVSRIRPGESIGTAFDRPASERVFRK